MLLNWSVASFLLVLFSSEATQLSVAHGLPLGALLRYTSD